MRWNIPAFRLPPEVLDEEVNAILDTGVTLRYNSPVASMKKLLGEGYDAVFVGSGAPKGKELDVPGRHDGNSNDSTKVIDGRWFAHSRQNDVERQARSDSLRDRCRIAGGRA